MRATRLKRILVATATAIGGLQMLMVGAADAAALTDVQWSVSNAHPSSTSVRYTYTFTVATTDVYNYVDFALPASTGNEGSATLGYVYGLPTGGTVSSPAADTVRYDFANTSVASGISIQIAFDALTNTSTNGNGTTTITMYDDAGTPAAIDTGSDTVNFDDNSTDLTVVIARTITFANDTDAITLLMDPGLAATSDRTASTQTLNVSTNAGGGYDLYAQTADDLENTGDTRELKELNDSTGGTATCVAAGSFTTNRWGYTVNALTDGSAAGNTAAREGSLATGQYCGHPTAAPTKLVDQTAPTNGDTIPVVTRAKIDYLQAADIYTTTITYTATPTY